MPRKRKSLPKCQKGRDSRGRDTRQPRVVQSEIPTTVVESTVAETISEPLSTLPPATRTLQAPEPKKQRRSVRIKDVKKRVRRRSHEILTPEKLTLQAAGPSKKQTCSAKRPRLSTPVPKSLNSDVENQAVQQERKRMRQLSSFMAAATRIGVQTYKLGEMNLVCKFCKARYFAWEVPTRHIYVKCCRGGRVQLPPIQLTSLLIRNLFELDDKRSLCFRRNILEYNSAFQFVSPKADLPVIPDSSSLVYVIQGKLQYCVANSLRPKQAQNRCLLNDTQSLDKNVLSLIDSVLLAVNPFSDAYTLLRGIYEEETERARQQGKLVPQLVLELVNSRDNPLQQCMINEVAAIYSAADSLPVGPNLRIYVRNQNDLQLVPCDNPNIDALTFPLLFPHGDPGWSCNMLRNDKINICQYYTYRLAYRHAFQTFYRGGLLTQQYIVHAYVKIEANRLKHILANQDLIQAEESTGLADHLVHHRDRHSLVILPSSFMGSDRWQQLIFQDALAVVSKYDNPSLFITFSCNPKWPAIIQNIPEGDNPFNHPMLIARVFQQMLHTFIDDIVTARVFGVSVVQLSVVEFQKNGLPYANIFAVFRKKDKLLDSFRIDQLISAEIPDPAEEPELYELVATHMIHGPCGIHNLNSPCMEEGQCTENYPRPLVADTVIQNNGSVIYRRRMNDRHIDRGNNDVIKLDNSWVIPYNTYSLLRYRCYVKVEACASAETVKYLHKYFFKTPDQSLVQIEELGRIKYSEVEAYLNRRYVSPPEASWHINQFLMYESGHTVIRLPVHLPPKQVIRYRNVSSWLWKSYERSQLTDWFRLNRDDPEANALLYEEVPLHYVWKHTKCWAKRNSGCARIIVRMFTVSTRSGELFYLRLLLLHVRGCTSFDDLRTVDGDLCPTFEEACRRRNLLADDSEWHRCIVETVTRRMTSQTRQLFAYILVFCEVSNAFILWTEFKANLVEDFLLNGLDEDTAEQCALGKIQEILRIHGRGNEEFQLPLQNPIDNSPNRFDVIAERNLGVRLRAKLNADQLGVYETVMAAVRDENVSERLFYLDGSSGSGKTFLFNTIITSLLGDEIIVLSVACTDLAARTMKGGKTVYNQFKLTTPVVDDSCSSMNPNTAESRSLIDAKIIIWDEINTATRFELEQVNSMLRDLCQTHLPFGGKVVLLGGDFRQCLPNVHYGHRLSVVDACIKSSHLWLNFTPLRLYTNVRTEADQQEFSRWLLELGNDTLPHVWIGNRDYVEIPRECLVNDIEALIRACFGDIRENDIFNKAILTPLNKNCQIINNRIVNNLPGEPWVYYSADSVEDGNDNDVQTANYPVEFLNSLTPPGMPPHRLALKVGALITLLRNLNVHRNLCNGTQLIVQQLGTNYIDVEQVDGNGCLTGERVFIPRIDFLTTDISLPFKFRRRQFPVVLGYAMTINSAQSRTLDTVGIYLPNTVISHGQLYMAFSRARRLDSVFVYLADTPQQGNLKNDDSKFTKNIVYTEIL